MKTSSTVSEQSEILILSNGKILAHNITPEMAAVLCELDPQNKSMRQRAGRTDSSKEWFSTGAPTK
jgi:hypothetical protein